MPGVLWVWREGENQTKGLTDSPLRVMLRDEHSVERFQAEQSGTPYVFKKGEMDLSPKGQAHVVVEENKFTVILVCFCDTPFYGYC